MGSICPSAKFKDYSPQIFEAMHDRHKSGKILNDEPFLKN